VSDGSDRSQPPQTLPLLLTFFTFPLSYIHTFPPFSQQRTKHEERSTTAPSAALPISSGYDNDNDNDNELAFHRSRLISYFDVRSSAFEVGRSHFKPHPSSFPAFPLSHFCPFLLSYLHTFLPTKNQEPSTAKRNAASVRVHLHPSAVLLPTFTHSHFLTFSPSSNKPQRMMESDSLHTILFKSLRKRL